MTLDPSFDRDGFASAMQELECRRLVVLYWMGIVFYLFFALLDYLVAPQFLLLFFSYRVCYAAVLVFFLYLLHRDGAKALNRYLLIIALLLGAFFISVMAARLGGFSSGYYLGILLLIAGAFPLLPFTALQAMFISLVMYLIYMLTVVVFQAGTMDIEAAVSNSIFFLSVIGVVAAQCHDDLLVRKKMFIKQQAVADTKQELAFFTGDLEELVDQRVREIEQAELKFRHLYENIFDLVVLADGQGKVLLVNNRCHGLLGVEKEEIVGNSLFDYILAEDHDLVTGAVFSPSSGEGDIPPCQFRMRTGTGRVIDVESGCKPLNLDNGSRACQLIIKDITTRKEMERRLIASLQLEDNSRRSAIIGLAKLAEYRDDETGNHLDRIQEYTRILTGELAKNPVFAPICTNEFIRDMYFSSILHDIGKIGIPDSILQKPARLLADEFDYMQRHCEFGGMALAEAEKDTGDISFLALGQEIAWHHHEKWDGSGYPNGLSGEDIPLSARIVALTDVYDALTSPRCYKAALSHEEAREIIVRDRGRHFDPRIVDGFLDCEHLFRQVRKELLLHVGGGAPGQ